jgi:phosphoribosylanthranilate isomerase
MALKTIVKVGKISNLSDARYCAGMSVDMLGFRVIPGSDHYVTPELFKEIRGWFSGPTVVAEIYGIEKGEDLPLLIQQYLPDLFELSLTDLVKIHSPSSGFILATTYEEVLAQEDAIAPYRNQIAFILVPATTEKPKLEELAKQFKVLVDVRTESDLHILTEIPALRGIVLHGSAEDKPGLKNYDALSGILEKLETGD